MPLLSYKIILMVRTYIPKAKCTCPGKPEDTNGKAGRDRETLVSHALVVFFVFVYIFV